MDAPGRTPRLLNDLQPGKVLIYAGLLAGALGIGMMTYLYGLVAGLIVAAVPASLCFIYASIRNPIVALFALFIVNYFIMGLARYAYYSGIPMGTLLDAMIAYNLLVLALHAIKHKVLWKRARTWLSLMGLIWLIYGVLELVNPQTVSVSGWFSSVRSISFHFFLIVVLTQIIVRDFRYVRYLIYLWSVLTLLAVTKALIQKFVGFDATELHWLYVLGGHTTHLIHSGARYFSFFSDAANFGASMGLSMVVFSITALHLRSKPIKTYLLLVAAVACYGMLISGTRSALAVPFAGYAFYIILSKRTKIILLGGAMMLALFVFFNYTYIGQGNAIIRRTRSAFNPNDPSLVVRLENQKKLREIMVDKPFGAGIGHGGGKAKEFAPDAPLSQVPTDSWFVLIWVETGVIGIIIHLLTLLSVICYGSFLVMFRLRHEQLRGIIAAMLSGMVGIVLMSYANEIFGQIPMGVIMYMSMSFIYLAPRFDQQLLRAEFHKSKFNESFGRHNQL